MYSKNDNSHKSRENIKKLILNSKNKYLITIYKLQIIIINVISSKYVCMYILSKFIDEI